MDSIILKDLHRLFAYFVLTKTLLDQFIQTEKDHLKSFIDQKSSEIEKLLREAGTSDNIINSVKNELTLPYIFHKLSVKKLQKLIQEESRVFVRPRTQELDLIYEKGRTKGKLKWKKRRVSFQFFSIRDTILAVLQQKSNFDKVIAEKQAEGTMYKSDIDGAQLRDQTGVLPHIASPESGHRSSMTIRILLYADDFEITNPLGSKTKKHKMNGVYFKIQNLQGDGQLKNVFLHAIARTIDVGRYGFNTILEPFVNEMLNLIDEGIECELHGHKLDIRVRYVGVTGDTLGVHDILQLLSPSANRFCRDCLVSRPEYAEMPWMLGPMRTDLHYSTTLDRAKRLNRMWLMRKFSYKTKDTILKKLHLSPRSNHKFDILHDLYEGVTMLVVKVVLNFIITHNIFTAEFLNERIKNFDYGCADESAKPSPNFDDQSLRKILSGKLKQNASQMHLLVRALPFLIHDKLREFYNNAIDAQQSEVEELLQLLSCHLRIISLVNLREITTGQIDLLDRLVRQQNRIYHQIRLKHPTFPLPNKLHHLLHYSQMIRQWGPAPLYETSRFEGLHKRLKQRMSSSCNFRNPQKTIADRYAIYFSYIYSYPEEEPEFEPVSCQLRLSARGEPIYVGSQVKYRGVRYQSGQILCLRLDDSNDTANPTPIFGQIEEISYSLQNGCSFTVKLLNTDFFDVQFNAYQVSLTEMQDTWVCNSLEFKEPFVLWRNCTADIEEEKTFVPLKTANI